MSRGWLLLLLPAVVSCTGKRKPPVARQSTLADSADQVMFGATFNLTDKGLLRAELAADRAYFFDENTRVELEPVHMTFFTNTGAKNAVLTAKRGTYNTRASSMVARGDVVVVSEDGRRLTSPELRYEQVANQISSDSAFVLTEPGRRLEGIGFRADPNLQNIHVLKTLAGQSGSFTIPNH